MLAFKLICDRANLAHNLKRAKIAVHELLAAIKRQAQILRMQKHKVTESEGNIAPLLVRILGHEVLGVLDASLGMPERLVNDGNLALGGQTSHRYRKTLAGVVGWRP